MTVARMKSRYRIGYLNPYRNAAENQIYASMRVGAARIGHDLIAVSNSDEILAANLDFVIAAASTTPKLTNVPTFLNLHEPRTRWWESEAHFWNLLTYDGYLTISDSLDNFIKAFCAGFGKDGETAVFFLTPQRQLVRSDIGGLIERNALNLCYFGTNWDARSRPLFRELARRPYMQIRGPEGSWKYLPPSAYYGSVPFDGQSVQTIYAANGVGLIVQSRNHVLDDVASNRIFEICSVGAIAISPEMPWIRKTFGDAAFYYDPWAPAVDIGRQVDAAMAELRRDPAGAVQRAETARTIFERDYSAEVVIDNTVKYYQGWLDRTASKSATMRTEPMIDVIVRVGGRPVELVARAIRSIDEQTAGRFRIVIVRYKPLDVTPLTDTAWNNIESFEIVDLPGGDRAHTMGAGLQALRSPYFATLDDDDFWLPDHVASMWRVLKDFPPDRGLAYCGLMDVEEFDGDTAGQEPKERRKIVSLSPARGDFFDIVGKFGTINFIASTKLLEGMTFKDWHFKTAEDTLTICHMLPKAEVGFSWRATVCTSVHLQDRSNYKVESLARKEDVIEVFLRIGPRIEQIERKFPPTPSTVWGRLGQHMQEVFEAKSRQVFGSTGKLVLEEGLLGTSIHDRDDLELFEVPLNPATVGMSGATRIETTGEGRIVMVEPPEQAWAFGAMVELPQPPRDFESGWIVVEFDNMQGSFGVGLLNHDGSDFYTRIEAPRRDHPLELWFHITRDASVSKFVIQNWTSYDGNTARLRRMWLARVKTGAPTAGSR